MKGKRFFIKLLKTALLLLSILIFCVIYLLPSIKKINHLKRSLKDKTIALADFQKIEQTFLMPGQGEIDCFREIDQALKRSIPEIDPQKGKAALHKEFAAQILAKAVQYHLRDPIICTRYKRESTFSILSPDSRGGTQRLRNLLTRGDQLVSRAKLHLFRLGGGPASLLGRDMAITSTYILMIFKADLKWGIRFIHHLKKQQMMLPLESLQILATKDLPEWLVLLRLYYIDPTSLPLKQSHKMSRDFVMVDLDAPILLRDISSYVKKMGKDSILPDQFGGGIFTSRQEIENQIQE
jgi:hypothetical protein